MLPQSPGLPPDKPLHQAIHLSQAQTTCLHLHRHTNEHLLQWCLTNNKANLTEPYNQGIKMQVTTKDINKENRLSMKPLPLKALCAKGVFQIRLPISGVNFSNNISIPQLEPA